MSACPSCSDRRASSASSRSSSTGPKRRCSTNPSRPALGWAMADTKAGRLAARPGELCMNIHEYQAKAVLRDFGVPVPRGAPAFTVEDAVQAARQLGGPVWGVKAQIHAGGRGKAGGGKGVKSIGDVQRGGARLRGS